VAEVVVAFVETADREILGGLKDAGNRQACLGGVVDRGVRLAEESFE
jgi:hypothetical protein